MPKRGTPVLNQVNAARDWASRAAGKRYFDSIREEAGAEEAIPA